MPPELETSTAPLKDGPSYHYYRAPYPILSFLYGLYCDESWSHDEYEKWEAGKRDVVTLEYRYEKYLDPYPGIPRDARRVITKDVANLPKPVDDERRKPRILDCDAIWPDLSNELAKASQPRTDGRAPVFKETRPVLSSLACIYLGDSKSVAEIVGTQKDGAKLLPVVLLDQLISIKSSGGSLESFLAEIRPRLFSEFIAPKNSW